MAKRTITTLLGAAIALLVAAPAHATLVYVKQTAGRGRRVFVADDDGTNPHRSARALPRCPPTGAGWRGSRPATPSR